MTALDTLVQDWNQVNAATDFDLNVPLEYLNAGDLNRIEQKIKLLRKALNSRPYNVPCQIHRTQWKETCIPTTDDIRRICKNITQVTGYYYRPYNFNEVTDPKFTLEAKPLNSEYINNLENNLEKIYELLIRGIHYITWGHLCKYKYEDLESLTYEELQKGFNYDAFIKDPSTTQII